MDQERFVKELTEMVGQVPEKVEVLSLQQPTLDDVERRMQRLLGLVGERTGTQPERHDLVREQDRSVFRLPLGARLVGYHASGAVKFTSGLRPMEKLIGAERDPQELLDVIRPVAELLDLPSWAGTEGELQFERLWQIKACAAHREGSRAETVVCRATGAFRHVIRGLPVWGPASAVVQVGGDSAIDTISIVTRATGEVVDASQPIQPAEGAQLVVRQLSGLIPEAGRQFMDTATPISFRFGYVSLPKRVQQRFLAPAYVAEVRTEGEESMRYLAAVSATEKEFLPLPRVGEMPAIAVRRE